MSELDTHVYIIAAAGDVGPVKVGISNAPYGRLFTLQTASPLELRLIHSFPMPSRQIALDVERMFHETQACHRIRGEWFNMGPGTALLLLVMGIDVALHYHCPDFDDAMKAACLDKCGVTAARALMVAS